jgi:hypothetical protein
LWFGSFLRQAAPSPSRKTQSLLLNKFLLPGKKHKVAQKAKANNLRQRHEVVFLSSRIRTIKITPKAVNFPYFQSAAAIG